MQPSSASAARLRTTLDPKLDIVFWMLFGQERNRTLLVSLLTAVLQPPFPIERIEVLRSEPEKPLTGDKDIALDVRVRFEGGEQADIEMQTQPRPALRERFLYYWARVYGGQLPRGADYPALRRCAVILFTTFPVVAVPRFHSTFRIQEQHSRELLTEHLEIHVLELPQLGEALARNDEPNLLLWGKFLSAQSDAELEVLAMQHPVMKQAKAALEELSGDPDARIRAEMREMALLSYQLDMAKVREQGIAEGEARGKAEGKAEMLHKLLVFKFGELPESVLRRLAKATDTEREHWFERALTASSLEEALDSPIPVGS